MDQPLQLSFDNMDSSEWIETLVREKVGHLEKFGRINSCHVHVSAPHRRHRRGNLYGVRIEVRVPGTELFVDSFKGDAHTHENVQIAVRDAFHSMERKLKQWKAKVGGDVKTHEGPLQGKVAEIDHERGFGQILATDHRLIYFHRNSVLDDAFDELKRDHPVELVVQDGESDVGPQASTVRRIGVLRFAAR